MSLCAGLPTSLYERHLPAGTPVVRVMPNTPMLVGEAMSAISAGSHAEPEHLQLVQDLLSTVGKVVRVPEAQQDAVTALSGSGPAYFFFLVEAMIDAGILLGLPRAVSAELIIQSAVGAATMLRDSGEHPDPARGGDLPGRDDHRRDPGTGEPRGAGRAAVRHRGGRPAFGRTGQGARTRRLTSALQTSHRNFRAVRENGSPGRVATSVET